MLLGTFGLEKGVIAGAATSCAPPKARQNTGLGLRPRTPVGSRREVCARTLLGEGGGGRAGAGAGGGGVKRCVLTRVLTRS